ncbi:MULTISPECIES: MFS transporter [Pseudonocardia]|uniref:Inner membrane transport protein YdhP n=2 Tax=Pseudonocardia TaxID=1847 RepID=A0A1Y2MWD6_PSEAH|nr:MULTISPECIES: MFS transporter [Pseudonocardia]OSY39472.1 Inner membrane transport protein YdhP [Pseudonocardia autotrophica]TDN75290.1 DHA1 family chloramphenicol resistance protein-like MFS transporter [Pseudonocardia autotrophica]BBF99236.1 chloramphenicol resistance protein [Pseudonocardia autotrophica]GEC24782.1 chloramphenicol resistance protein [Pseudonocardia saturnea]
MPLLLYVLACAVFVQAMSEFMLAGLVSQISADLAVSIPAAGGLTSAFAAGMVIGAPVMAVAVRRLPSRSSLLVFLTVFVAVHVVGALTSVFAVLAVTRVLAAFANAGFLAVALTVAVRIAPAGRAARATTTLLAGTTLALVAGVPAGAVLGQAFGWRATFWVVAALGVLGLLGLLLGMPTDGAGNRSSGVPFRRELSVLGRSAVVRTLLAAALVNGGTFAVYVYLDPLLTGPGKLPVAIVPVGLAVFGIGSFAGVALAGRYADTRARLLLGAGAGVLGVGWVGLGVLLGAGWPVLALVGLQAALGFAVGATAIARSLVLVAEAGTLGGAATTAALNVGATVGPLFGGWALAGSGTGPVWVAAALVAVALLPILLPGGVAARSGTSDRAPLHGAPVDRAPVDRARADRSPADGVPADRARADGAPADGAPGIRGPATDCVPRAEASGSDDPGLR